MDATEKVQRKSILRGHSGPVYDVSYTAQGRYLMSVSEDTTMRLWDLKSGVNKAIYHGHSYPIWSVDADRVGFNLVTGQFESFWIPNFFFIVLIDLPQRARIDLNKRFLPRPNTTTA